LTLPEHAIPKITIPREKLERFCAKWRVSKLELFGSALREDFGPTSDVDFLVTFMPDARWTLFDLVGAESELSAIVGRPVDLVERPSIEVSRNWIRRKAVLANVETLYVA
jgi:predicted nucleotidyltransferase